MARKATHASKHSRPSLHRHLRLSKHVRRVGSALTLEHLSTWLIHELSQPLTAILSTAQGSQRLLAGPRVRIEELKTSFSAITAYERRASSIIQRLRNRLPRSEWRRSRVDVNELILEIISLLENDGDLPDTRVRLTLAQRLPRVVAAREQLRQALLNLTVNAIEAMLTTPPGERRLWIRTTVRSMNPSVHIVVRDTGAGIPAEDSDQIFETLVSTKPGAAGLGLPIARSIIADHGGRIWLGRRRPGAEFHVTLPLVPPDSGQT